LVGTGTINSASAQQTTVTKAEAALSAKIKCEDFKKNSDGTWTSGPNTKIGTNAFPNHTFDTQGVSIGEADLATVLNRKCGG
jgi:small-conductance mechanosensitive channel